MRNRNKKEVPCTQAVPPTRSRVQARAGSSGSPESETSTKSVLSTLFSCFGSIRHHADRQNPPKDVRTNSYI